VPDRTEWHNIVAWRGLASLAEKYIRKGRQLYIEGKLQTRSWEKDGVKRYATEVLADNIQLLGARPETIEPLAPGPGTSDPKPPVGNDPVPTTEGTDSLEEKTDDLPF